MSHKSFNSDMIYALIQHYNNDDQQTYSKIYIEDWWWEMQKELLDNAILILLLILINKTVFIQYQDNLSVWLIYLMIKNLNWHITQA